MNPEAMLPHGLAILAYFRGDKSAELKMHRDDGELGMLSMSHYFRSPDKFSVVEVTALDLCKGRILDVGAGGGIHTLELLARGMTVKAIDVSPETVEVLKERGIGDAACVDVFNLDDESFDTLLMLGHGIGMVEDLLGLKRFLKHAQQITSDEGQIVLHSLDVRKTDYPLHLAYHAANRKAGRYFGEVRLRLEFEGKTGPTFGWLHVDPDTLRDEAEKTGWNCQIALIDDEGEFLARLTKK